MSATALRRSAVVLTLALLCLVPAIAHADSWLPPTRKVHLAADRSARFVVIPGDHRFYEEGDLREARRRRPRGHLYRRGPRGEWRRVWNARLVNNVAPVSAMLAPGGAHVVTFDNWAGIGTGDDVIAVYDASGRLVRSFSLRDLLPDVYIRALPWSYGSIYWAGEHRFSEDGRRLNLSVNVPSDDEGALFGTEHHVEFEIELETGRILPPDPQAWAAAHGEACRLSASRPEGWWAIYSNGSRPAAQWPPFPADCKPSPASAAGARGPGLR